MLRSPRVRLAALAAGLLLISTGLAVSIIGQLREAQPVERAAAPSDGLEPGALTMPGYELPPLEAFAELMARPLFSSTRRPIEADGEPAAVVAGPQGLDATLTGVIIAEESKVALIMPRNGNKPVRLIEGQRYQGWTLSEVDSEGVIFRQGTQAKILELDRKPGAAIAKN